MSFSDQLDQLEERIGGRVGNAVEALRDEVRRRIEESQRDLLRHLDEATAGLPKTLLSRDDLAPLAERAGEAARAGAFVDLAGSLAALDRGRSQAEVLNTLLAEAGNYASRTVLFLTRGAGAEAWGAHGWGAGVVTGLTVAYETDGWRRFAAGAGVVALRSSDCAALCSRIESPLPAAGVLVPLVLRDRVAAALYADRLEEGRPLAIPALQALTFAAALIIESLPFRERAQTPTLGAVVTGEEAGGEVAGLALWDAAAPATVVAAPTEPAPDWELEEAALAAEPAAPPAAEAAEPEPIPAAEPAEVEAAAAEEVGEVAAAEEVEFEELAPTPWSLDGLPAELEIAEEAAGEELTAEEFAPLPEPVAQAEPTEEPATLDAVAAHETVLLDTSRFAPPTAEPPTYAPPPEPPEEQTQPGLPRRTPAADRGDRAGGSAQVAPPSDFEGPGFAFSTTHVPAGTDDAARHEEARRLARLLVSEIRLYNEDLVEEGRRNRDLYARLREDIERSRQMYEERVEAGILEATDYFDQELVRILGAGDVGALGRQ